MSLTNIKELTFKYSIFCVFSQVDELRNKLEQKNKLIEKKTQEALQVGLEYKTF